MSATTHSQESTDRETVRHDASKDPEKAEHSAPSPTAAAASPASNHYPLAAYLTLVGGWFALFCGFG